MSDFEDQENRDSGQMRGFHHCIVRLDSQSHDRPWDTAESFLHLVKSARRLTGSCSWRDCDSLTFTPSIVAGNAVGHASTLEVS